MLSLVNLTIISKRGDLKQTGIFLLQQLWVNVDDSEQAIKYKLVLLLLYPGSARAFGYTVYWGIWFQVYSIFMLKVGYRVFTHD